MATHDRDRKGMKICPLLFGAAALIAGMLLYTCSKKSNPTGPDDGGDTVPTYSYIKIGDTSGTLRITIPEQIDTSRYCDPIDDTLVSTYDTIPLHYVLYSFTLAGSALTLIRNDTAVYSRSGSESGITGTWTAADTVPDFPVRMVFTDTSVALSFVVTGNCEGDDYIQYLWPLDSADYYLTLNRISCTRLELYGTVSGETVTMSWNAEGDLTVTSSNAAHAAHTRYTNPLSCPNSEYPDWYYAEFLNPNSRY